MSKFFECEALVERDDHNVALQSHVWWTEEASWRHAMRGQAWAAILASLGCGLIAIPLAMAVPVLGLLVLAPAACGMVWGVGYLTNDLPMREIIFLADGSIALPDGIPDDPSLRRLRLRQDEVATVQDGNWFGPMRNWTRTVGLVTFDGHTITVGKMLHEVEAREVVMKLTLALREMRGSGMVSM